MITVPDESEQTDRVNILARNIDVFNRGIVEALQQQLAIILRRNPGSLRMTELMQAYSQSQVAAMADALADARDYSFDQSVTSQLVASIQCRQELKDKGLVRE
ncbi:MAG: hypothetical protein Alpg2KO_01340 [Alphaproteobacteria bacterium]